MEVENEMDSILPPIAEIPDEFGSSSEEGNPETVGENMAATRFEDERFLSYSSWLGHNIAEFTSDNIKQLVFQSWEEAESFYIQYSKQVGFGIRRRDAQTNASGHCRRRTWVCRKEGVRDEKNLQSLGNRARQPRPETRVNCSALMTVKLVKKTGVWVVQRIVTEHSHDLAKPNHVAFISSHRSLGDGDMAQALSLRHVGVRTSQITELISKQKGGYHQMGFTHKDMHNMLSGARAKEVISGDVNKAFGYFEAKKGVDPGFFFLHTTTASGEVEHMFWADSISKKEYGCFGDVVAFDACYRRLLCDHALIIMVGINNHDQSIVFGVALLKDEQAPSYVWLLQTFLQSMGGKRPSSIVTDGCHSMRRAIKHVIPEATHRLCIWHIKRNACREVKHRDFLKKFERCIDVEDVEDFEVLWVSLVEEHNIATSKWAQLMYNDRYMWGECFLKGKFFGGLRTTSRCEGMHSFLNAWLSPQLYISEFVVKFDDALSKIRFKECELEFKCLDSTPVCSHALRVFEKHASHVYTLGAFQKFRQQLDVVVAYSHDGEIVSQNLTCRTYKVNHYQHPRRHRLVVYDEKDNALWCECKFMENHGIPCRHQIYVMKVEGMRSIPDNCILWRWTRESSKGLVTPEYLQMYDPDVLYNIRFGALSSMANTLCRIGATDQGTYETMYSELMSMTQRFSDIHLPGSHTAPTGTSLRKVIDPPMRKRKSAQRLCGGCRMPGHTKLTCPRLNVVGTSYIDSPQTTYHDMTQEGNMNMGSNSEVFGLSQEQSWT